MMKRLRMGALMDDFIWIRSYVVHDQGVQGSQWSPSGKYYLSYGEDKSIRVHDPEIFPTTLKILPRLQSITSLIPLMRAFEL